MGSTFHVLGYISHAFPKILGILGKSISNVSEPYILNIWSLTLNFVFRNNEGFQIMAICS